MYIATLLGAVYISPLCRHRFLMANHPEGDYIPGFPNFCRSDSLGDGISVKEVC